MIILSLYTRHECFKALIFNRYLYTVKNSSGTIKKIKGFPLKIKSFRNTETYKMSGRAPFTPPCTTVGAWICVYVRGSNVTCTARFVKVRLLVIKAKAIFTKYRITLEQTRKPYQIGLLLKHKNDHFGTISETERSCSAPILKLVEIGFCHDHSSPRVNRLSDRSRKKK